MKRTLSISLLVPLAVMALAVPALAAPKEPAPGCTSSKGITTCTTTVISRTLLRRVEVGPMEAVDEFLISYTFTGVAAVETVTETTTVLTSSRRGGTTETTTSRVVSSTTTPTACTFVSFSDGYPTASLRYAPISYCVDRGLYS